MNKLDNIEVIIRIGKEIFFKVDFRREYLIVFLIIIDRILKRLKDEGVI